MRELIDRPGWSLRRAAAEIKRFTRETTGLPDTPRISHTSLAAFIKHDKPATPFGRTLNQIESFLEAVEGGRFDKRARADQPDPAVRLACLLEARRALAALLARLPAGELLSTIYQVAANDAWPQEAMDELDAIAVDFLRQPAVQATAVSRAERIESAILVTRLAAAAAPEVARILNVVPPTGKPGEQRRRPRRAQAQGGGEG